jgi:type 1 fimbria pilin
LNGVIVDRSPRPARRRQALLALMLLIAGLLSAPAMAASCYTVQAPGIQLTGSFSVPRDLQPYQAVDTSASVNYVFYCRSISKHDGAATVRMVLASPSDYVATIPNGVVVRTSLAGVGIAITGPPGTTYDSSFGGFVLGAVTRHRGQDSGYVNAALTYQLVATGPITSGSITIPGELLHFDFLTQRQGPQYLSRVTVPGSEHITALACRVDVGSRNMVVTLPDTPASSFTGIGSTAGDTGFQLSLTCQAGTSVNISMSSGSADAAHAGVVRSAAGSGYARGVGVQVLDRNGMPMPISDGSSAPTRVAVGAAPNGPMTIPFSARYFQTATPVTGGRISATVTFTMTYQ